MIALKSSERRALWSTRCVQDVQQLPTRLVLPDSEPQADSLRSVLDAKDTLSGGALGSLDLQICSCTTILASKISYKIYVDTHIIIYVCNHIFIM